MHNQARRELFLMHLRGETPHARSFRELNLHKLDIRQPSELIANSPVLQQIVRKHWQSIIVPWLKR